MRTINERTISQENPEDEWLVKLIHDESSNTTLGGTVMLGKEREQKSSRTTYDKHCIYNWMDGWHTNELAQKNKEGFEK
jgi:hypothetical protein